MAAVDILRTVASDLSSNWHGEKKQDSPTTESARNQAKNVFKWAKKHGVHSVSLMAASGFRYTGNEDEARCEECKLELSNWTLDAHPFTIHSKQRPDCPFVRSMTKWPSVTNISSATTAVPNIGLSNESENPSKRLKIESVISQISANTLLETDSLRQIRRRTFSHWPPRILPSPAQMIEAGFFNCNVGDRVICIYCNLICQRWTSHTDDPCEVHKTLSPKCIYVIAKLVRPAASSIVIVNEPSIGTSSTTTSVAAGSLDPLRSNEIVFTAACNPAYTEIPKRHASFATWPVENLPPVDDLIQAGFFYTGKKAIVTCFYCNGSLQNWGSNDNPTIEHARWFPYCLYAKQLCGDDLYRKIQESQRAQQERARANEQKERASTDGVAATTSSTTNSRQWLIPDESTLDQGHKLSIIKRCWEDQLRVKQDDFQWECDLFIACLILQKQSEHIDGKKENIVIPSVRMKEEYLNNFKEDKSKTVERERSLISWPLLSPSRLSMLTAGWQFSGEIAADHTFCPHCGTEKCNWSDNDNPRDVHQQLSPSCSFLRSFCPLEQSSVIFKPIEVLHKEDVETGSVDKIHSPFLSRTTSFQSYPSNREQAFASFSNNLGPNTDASIKSGFYPVGTPDFVKCYHCSGLVDNLHLYSPHEINREHRRRFPECQFARFLPQADEIKSTNNNKLCQMCRKNDLEVAAIPCGHAAICFSCSKLVDVCIVCGEKPRAFCRIYI